MTDNAKPWIRTLSKLPALLSLVFIAGCATAKVEALFVPESDAWTVWSAHDATSTATINHDIWDAFLAKYIKPDTTGLNRVAYGAVTAEDDKALRDYISALETIEISTYNRDEQYAYWANLYNSITIRTILDNYPITSIRKIDGTGPLAVGPWGLKLATVEGREVSLDDIESRIMRPLWNDPRVHYAVNCASIGCPNLRMTAFRGATLDADLDEQARIHINNPRGVSIVDGKLRVSSIYAWFEGDFGGSQSAVLAHLKKYAAPDLKAKLEGFTSINGYDYDWDLNDHLAAAGS